MISKLSMGMKYYYPVLLAILTFHAGTLMAAVETTSATDSSATASVSGDLLETSLSSTGWPANNNINNGTTGTFDENSAINPAKVVNAGTYDFSLDLSDSAAGYDISEVNCFSGWSDNRAGQSYTLYFSFVGDSGFTQITPSTVSVAASGQSLVTQVFDGSGALLGSGVDGIRFVVGVNGLGNVWREIDVVGVAADLGVKSFLATPSFIAPGDPVTLSWEVGDSVTAVSIDQGVGDVSSLTDVNGVGSVILDPGPDATTTYTLSAVLPNAVNQSSVDVSVSDQPLIYSFTADAGMVSSGTSVNLSWQVANVMTLLLNGVDVTGLAGTTVNPVGQEHFTLLARNANGSELMELTLFGISAGDAIISEFMAMNDSSLIDEDGDYSDWIEIHNPTTSPINLGGYFLTDDEDNLQKWMLPTTTLLPGEYLVVFASSKNRALSGSELHANFSLSGGGEYLALVKPDGVTLATEFSPQYPDQRSDVSYGYDFTRLGYHYFLVPSPGESNGDSILGFVKDTKFTLDRGFYSAPIQVGISSATQGAGIRYTLDGTKPTASSGFVYSEGSLINIFQTTVLRAAAFKNGFEPSNVDTHSYIFPADVIADSSMDTAITQDPTYGPQMIEALTSVPTVSLNFVGDLDYTEREVSMELINFEDGNIQVDAGMERFGGHATDFAKRSMRFTFRSEYGTGKLNFQLFGNHGYSHFQPTKNMNSFDLRAGNHDMSQRGAYLSNRYADDALLDMGQIAPHGRFVHVYLNGEYWGQYHLREGWDAAMFSEYFGGSKEDYEAVDANDHFSAGLVVYDGSGEFWAEAETLAAGPQPFTNVRSHVDIVNEIDFILLYVNGNCESEFRAGGSAPQAVPFKFFLKDADGYLRNPTHAVLDDGPLDLMKVLREEGHPDFEMLVADRIQKHFFNDGALSPAKSIERLQNRVDEARLSILTECARWGYRTPASFFSYYENLTDNQLPGQSATMIAKFRAAGMYPSIDSPTFDPYGGSVSDGFQPALSTDAGVIYYTLDGSDPRLPGGAVSSDALIYSTTDNSSQVLVLAGSTWRYLDDGSDQGSAWRSNSFDDATWNSGAAKFGYGDGNETTTISYGPDSANKYTTTYFRKTFEVQRASDADSLKLSLLRDDGAVVYLNGSEILRNNMPVGTVSNTTFASSAAGTDEDTFYTFSISSDLLLEGTNVLAVELHQVSLSSSDVGFDFELETVFDGGTTLVSPITLTNDTVVMARVYKDGEWSALNDPSFWIGEAVPPAPGDLLISEINYNPDGSDDYEFIEIWNRGTNQLDLSGITISNAVRFVFPASTRLRPETLLVVVEDLEAFSNRYQNVTSPWYRNDITVAGEWVGGLADGGETLSLVATDGTIISSVAYRSDGEWPKRPDGDGSSLQLQAPGQVPLGLTEMTSYLDEGRNWSASSLYHGSPGRFEALDNELVINEVLSHTDVGVDWIELHNLGSSYVELSGLALTDDLEQPTRYLFPVGTTIDPGAFQTVSATDLNFGFSELGSDAALLELSGTNIIRIIDWVDFPAVQREEPFGRYERSDGEIDFTELASKTSGATNALPRVGPVVISEIMFAPELGKSEYVEIKNISSSAVPLYDVSIPTNTWAFSGVGDLTFPEGMVLAAGETVILCETNAAAFRTQYAIDPSVTILGPWTGGLDNGGEQLRLLSPGDPEFDGFVPMYRADHVSYRTNSVWPAASSSGGISLERSLVDSYGNDPISWTASLPGGSPGRDRSNTIYMGTSIGFTAGQEPSISFVSIEGETYEVHYTDSLIDSSWRLLEAFPEVTTNWVKVIDPATTNNARYYRILWQVNPED